MDIYSLFLKTLSVPYESNSFGIDFYYEKKGDTLFIFFEKSASPSDWKINFNFPAKPYKRMGDGIWFAHSGFLAAWKSIEKIIGSAILDQSVKRIICSGYSHGGALAMLCHEFVFFNRPDIRNSIHSYGFGAPRVFWGIATPHLKSRWNNYFVVRNIDDTVTHLPPLIFGYSHVGKLLRIGKCGNYTGINAHKEQNILKELSKSEYANKNIF